MKQFTKFILCLILVTCGSHPACAARGFGTTFGNSTSDAIQTGYSTVSAGTRTYSIWEYENSTTGGTIFNTESGGGSIENFGLSGASNFSYVRKFSVTAGIWTIPVTSSGAWHNVIITYDASSASNNPSVYEDCVSKTVTRGTAPVGSASTTSDPYFIGAFGGTGFGFDGKLAEFAGWSSILTTAEINAVCKGESPYFVRHNNLLFFFPLYGIGTSEPDYGPSHVTQTVTGTKLQPHPPISPFKSGGSR